MMWRLSLSTRIGLIVIVGLLALLLSLNAIAYWANDVASSTDLPEPQRIAALADLIDRTPEADRDFLLPILNSPTQTVWILSSSASEPRGEERRRADPAIISPYQAELGDRLIAVLSPPTSLLDRKVPRILAYTLNAVEFRVALNDGNVLVIETKSPFIAAQSGLPVGYGAGLLVTLLAFLTLLALHREIRSLSKLAVAVDHLDITGDPEPLPRIPTRAPEIKALIGAFERLQGRLAMMLRGRMALVGGIQHDVRTFATRLRLRVDHIPDKDERERAASDIADMMALLDDAMVASRTGADELDRELVAFAEIIRTDVADRRAAGAPVTLRIDSAAEAATLLGDRLALRRITANILDNALNYGKRAHAVLAAEDNSMVLTVDDEGPGIPENQRDMLLEPFVRLDPSRARQSGGAGLGLAIVRTLVEAHEGDVTIGEAPTGGARLTVRLPLFQN